MIIYLDMSALIKLYIKEEWSEIVRQMIRSTDLAATSKVVYERSYRGFLCLSHPYRSSIQHADHGTERLPFQ